MDSLPFSHSCMSFHNVPARVLPEEYQHLSSNSKVRKWVQKREAEHIVCREAAGGPKKEVHMVRLGMFSEIFK